MKTHLWFFRFCFEGTKKESLKWFGLAIIQALVFTGQLFIVKALLNSLHCFLNDDAAKGILFWFGFFILILTGEFVLDLLVQKTKTTLKKRQGLYVRTALVEAAKNYPWEKVTAEFSNNTAWLFENMESLTYTNTKIAQEVLFYPLVFIGLVLLWPASLRYLLFVFIGLAVVLFFLPVNIKNAADKSKDYFLKLLLEPNQLNKTNDKRGYLWEKHRKRYWQSCKEEDLYLLQTGFLSVLQEMVFLGFSLSLFFGGRSFTTLSLGDIFIFFKTVTIGYNLGIKARANIDAAQVAKLFLTQLQEILKQTNISTEKEEGDLVQISEQIGLEVKNLNYFYNDKPILKEINFKIKPGEKVAIIGAKGFRKITLIKNLLGIYKPQKGSVLLGGIPIQQFTWAQRTRYVAALLRPVKYPLSIKENITFQGTTQDDIAWEVATKKLYPLVKNLPEGLETILTKSTLEELELTHEYFANLWQNIFLARLLSRQTPIVVCDELKNLNPDFWKDFPVLFRTKTVLWFSESAASGRLFDRVLLLKADRIVESGTYETLIRLGGEYATLLKAQGGKM